MSDEVVQNEVMPPAMEVFHGKTVADDDQRTPAEYLATLTDLQREALKSIGFKNAGVDTPLEEVPTAILKATVANLEQHGALSPTNDAKVRSDVRRRTLKALKDRMLVLGLPIHLSMEEFAQVIGEQILNGLVEAGMVQTHGTLLAERRIRSYYQESVMVANADGTISSKETNIAVAKDMKEATSGG